MRSQQIEAALGQARQGCLARDGRISYLEAELDLSRSHAESRQRGLAALGAELEALRVSSRGQATRIRLEALREASEVSSRARRFDGASDASAERLLRSLERAIDRVGREFEAEAGGSAGAAAEVTGSAAGAAEAAGSKGGAAEVAGSNGGAAEPAGSKAAAAEAGAAETDRVPANGERRMRVDVGPFRDFSQLVSFEDAANAIGATGEISIRRFSEGRADIEVALTEPADLLRELEERCDLEFVVRSRSDDQLVLDLGE